MPDNVQLNPTTGGATVASDDIAGVQFQRVKLIHGADGVNDGDVSSGNPLPVTSRTTPGTLVNRSGTITAGGTAQQFAAANSSRVGWCLQNLDLTADLWVSNIGTASAGQPSFKIPPGSMYESPPGGQGLGAISVIGSTTGQAFSGREW